jgi:Zn-dependent protease
MPGAEAIGRRAQDCYKAILLGLPSRPSFPLLPKVKVTPIFLAALDNQTLIVGGLTLGFLIISLGIHEAAHAFVAWRCGDSTAKDLGRMTLDPIPHIDPFMTILLPAILFFTTGFMFGGAKPVPVNYHRLRNPLRDMMLVALAGPISNFLLAVLFLLISKLLVHTFGLGSNEIAVTVMYEAMRWNLLLAAFNMIPVPPLDGSRVMTFLLPQGLREGYASLERFGMLIIFGLFFLGVFRVIVYPIMSYLLKAADFLTGGVWA